ncbi:MAG: exo-alpha-sialidase [Lentisphaeria bacterium]|nr:exo-alpha-sialidase [Lentisphaeria bacterium]
MAIRLSFGEPRIVAQGPTYEQAGWGTHQFPEIRRLPDGRLAVSYHIVADTTEAYGLERGWATSSDGGRSWSDVTPEELPAVKARFGTRLPSGRNLRFIMPKPYPISPELHAKLTKIVGRGKNCIAMEDVPDGLFPKTWLFAVSGPETLEEEQYYCDLDFPGMTTGLTTGAIIRPCPFGAMKVAPDGSVWIARYANGRNPVNMGYTGFYACYYFRSTDEGRSFRLMSWIQYLPDTNDFPEAFLTEGFCEPDICWMPDGSMITVMRTGSFTPSYIARSTDGGRTWSKPERFDDFGVYPQLLHLKCGVTLCSYGRPALRVRATRDPSGMKWEEPCELMPSLYGKQEPWARSCFYTGLLPLDDDTAMLVFTDFQIPDKNGVKRKTVMVRTVHAECH